MISTIFLFLIKTIAIQEESQCFEMNQQIRGLQATQQLQVILKPKKKDQLSSFCSSLTGKSSFLKLNFLNVDNGLIPSSQNTTINMSESQIVYTIQIINNSTTTAADIYQQVAGQKEAQYNITFLGDIVLTGTIYVMHFHNLDATNCWSNGILNYYFNTEHAFVQLDVEPNDCAIDKKVEVELNFKSEKDDNWDSIPIPPSRIYSAQQGYYTSNTNYTHKNVKHFRVSLLSYVSNTSNLAKFIKMVNIFQSDRSFQFRLVLQTTDNHIKQEYYYDIKQWLGTNQSCFGLQKVFLQSNNFIIYVAQPNDTCISSLTQAEYLKITLFVNNTNDLQQFQHIVNTSSDYFWHSGIVRIPLETDWPLNQSQLQYTLYLTFCNTSAQPIFNSNVKYIDELVYTGQVKISCISQMNLILRDKEICVDFYVSPSTFNHKDSNGRVIQVNPCAAYLESNQQNSYFVAFYEFSELNLSERTYTLYTQQKLPSKIQNVNSFCFKETPGTNQSELMAGSLIKREQQQVKMLDKYGEHRSFAYYIDDGSCYIMDTITVDLGLSNYMWIIVVVLVSIMMACLFVYLQVKQP